MSAENFEKRADVVEGNQGVGEANREDLMTSLKEKADKNLDGNVENALRDMKGRLSGMPMYHFSADVDNPDNVCEIYVTGLHEYGAGPDEPVDADYGEMVGKVIVRLDDNKELQFDYEQGESYDDDFDVNFVMKVQKAVRKHFE